MRHWIWIGLVIVLVVAIAAACAAGLGYWYGNRMGAAAASANLQPSVPQGPPVVKVRVAPLRRQRMEETLTAYGTVVAALGEMQVFSEPFESRVVKVLVRAGQTIASGDPLIQVEPSPDTLLQLSEARDKRETAAGELNLVQQRLELRLATRSDLLQAQQQLQAAELRLRSLQQRGIDGAQVLHAQGAGLVSQINVQEGQIVAAGAPLLETIGENQIDVRLGIEKEDVAALHVGQPVRLLSVNAPENQAVEGKIHLITREVDPQTRLVNVFVTPAAGARLLLNGYVEGRVVTVAESVLAVPRSAVLPEQGKYVLYTVDQGHAGKHDVEVGMENDRQVQVIGGGLQEGQEVVVAGNAVLHDGMAVEVEPGP